MISHQEYSTAVAAVRLLRLFLDTDLVIMAAAVTETQVLNGKRFF